MRDQFRIKITDEEPGGKNNVAVKWVPIEPEETSPEPFSLESNEVIVPPKKIVSVKIVYDSNEIREYNSVVTCTPRFQSSDSDQQVDLGQLSVLLKSRTLNPELTLHQKVEIGYLAKPQWRDSLQVP